MSDTDGLREVIAKLEAAKEGSRGLDAEIAIAVFETQKTDDDLIYAKPCARSDNCAEGTYWRVQRSGLSLRTAPPYTTSLDAALTLVPDGFVVSLTIGPGPIRYAAVGMYETRGATPALALCIASLKARAAQSH